MPSNPISLPSGYAPAFAVGFADTATGNLAVVDGSKPLPVQTVAAVAPQAFSGTASASTSAGPFIPASGRPVMLTLSGTWTGTVQVRRSTDGGTIRHPITAGGATWGQFTGNACEPVWIEEETGAALYLEITLASGTVNYRLAQ